MRREYLIPNTVAIELLQDVYYYIDSWFYEYILAVDILNAKSGCDYIKNSDDINRLKQAHSSWKTSGYIRVVIDKDVKYYPEFKDRDELSKDFEEFNTDVPWSIGNRKDIEKIMFIIEKNIEYIKKKKKKKK